MTLAFTFTLAATLAAAAAAAGPVTPAPAPSAAAPAVFVLNGDEDESLVLEAAPPEDANAPGTDGGEAPAPKAPAVKAGTAYRHVDLGGAGATVKASGDGKIGRSGCGDGERPIVPFAKLPEAKAAYVLVPGDWPAAPKSIKTESAATPAYEAIAATALAASGIKAPKILAGQAVKADVDGDGIEDLVFTASNSKGDGDPKIGDWSALIVQRTKNGKLETLTPLVTLIDDSNIEMAEGPVAPVNIAAIADIDGDGKMEIVTYAFGMEEHYVDVWSVKPDGTVPITYQAYCGV